MGRDNEFDLSATINDLGWKSDITYKEAMYNINKWIIDNMVKK